jgi:hypothetical protein
VQSGDAERSCWHRNVGKRPIEGGGMAAMSAKFKEMRSSVYLDTKQVKQGNRVL